MPPFNPLLASGSLATGVAVGEAYNVVNNEVITAANYTSMPFTPIDKNYRNLSFTVNFASAPTAVVTIYGSNTYPTAAGPQNGVVLDTLTNSNGAYTDNSAFQFYWVTVTGYSAGGNLTVTAYMV